MDWRTLSARWSGGNEESPLETPRRWIAHASHDLIAAPHRPRPHPVPGRAQSRVRVRFRIGIGILVDAAPGHARRLEGEGAARSSARR